MHLSLLNHPHTQPRPNRIILQSLLTLILRIANPNRHLRPTSLFFALRPQIDTFLSEPAEGEGVEGRMEGKGVDRPDVVDVVDGLVMEFVRLFLFL